MSGYRDDLDRDHQKEGDGRLEAMAKDGTSMPDDPLTHRVIKSVPNPAQEASDQTSGADLAGAADNATDIPRSNADRQAGSSEVVTAYGDTMPAEIGTKRLNMATGDQAASKGHGRDEKAGQQNYSNEEALSGDGPDVEAAPGEEEDDQETLRSRREGQRGDDDA